MAGGEEQGCTGDQRGHAHTHHHHHHQSCCDDPEQGDLQQQQHDAGVGAPRSGSYVRNGQDLRLHVTISSTEVEGGCCCNGVSVMSYLKGESVGTVDRRDSGPKHSGGQTVRIVMYRMKERCL